MDQGHTYNLKHKPQWFKKETIGFNWDGRMYSMCNITKLPDWLDFLNQAFSLVMMLSSISWSLHDLSQQDFIHTYTLPIYTCHTPHILWKNPQVYTIQYSVQQGRNTKICFDAFQECSHINYVTCDYIVKEVIYLELSMLEGHQSQNMTFFIPTSFINLPTAYECMRGIF